MCNKGPVSGPELQAIKTAATDLRETAGIYLRNPDYVATAEPEQKAPSSGFPEVFLRKHVGEQQEAATSSTTPSVSASPTRARAPSRYMEGGDCGAGPPSRHTVPPRGWGGTRSPRPRVAFAAAGRQKSSLAEEMCLQPGGQQPRQPLQARCRGGVWGGPVVTVVACTSKKAVFHSGPASGGAYRGCQGKQRDKMLTNLLEILLARLAPRSDYGPSGRPSGRICGCAPSSRAGGPKTASCPLCPPAPLGRQPLATACPSVPAPRRATSPAQGPGAAALWKTLFPPHLRQTKLTSPSPRNNLRPPGAFWAIPKGTV